MERYFMQLEGEVVHFAHGKEYLVVVFPVCGTEGDRAMSPSSPSRDGSIHASRLFVEVQMERDFHAAKRRSWALCTWEKTTCLQFLPLFVV